MRFEEILDRTLKVYLTSTFQKVDSPRLLPTTSSVVAMCGSTRACVAQSSSSIVSTWRFEKPWRKESSAIDIHRVTGHNP